MKLYSSDHRTTIQQVLAFLNEKYQDYIEGKIFARNSKAYKRG